MTAGSEAPIVSTTTGRLRGFLHRGIEAFLGIPYARPPVGPYRFRAPAGAEPWGDLIRDATSFGAAPPQIPPAYMADVTDFDEDCLSLNVWVPSNRSGPLPVFVWLYGGGFKAGGTNAKVYSGHSLATEGFIVVSVNYRVGALGFGFFAHLHETLASSTNLGLKDVVLALSWIQANIAEFGGDPSRVTVAGQSAGAFLGGALLGAPSSFGTYSQLMMMSGGPFKIMDRADAECLGDALISKVGLAPSEVDIESLSRVPTASFIRAVESVTASDVGDRNGPRIQGLAVVDDSSLEDGILAEHPALSLEHQRQSDIRLLFTVAADEADFWIRQGESSFRTPSDPHELVSEMRRWGAPESQAVRLVDYYSTRTTTLTGTRGQLLSHGIFHIPALRSLEIFTQTRRDAWFAELEVGGSSPTGHFDEVRLLFGTDDRCLSEDEQRFSRDLREAVRGFVVESSPGWPRYQTDSPMWRMGRGPTEDGPVAAELLDLWKSIDRP